MVKSLNMPENMLYIFKENDYQLNQEDRNKVKDLYEQICELEKDIDNRPLISGLTTSALYWIKVACKEAIPVNKVAYTQIMKEAEDIIETFGG